MYSLNGTVAVNAEVEKYQGKTLLGKSGKFKAEFCMLCFCFSRFEGFVVFP